jgi:hypothetical protein
MSHGLSNAATFPRPPAAGRHRGEPAMLKLAIGVLGTGTSVRVDTPWVGHSHALDRSMLEFDQRCAGHHLDVPRLQVRSGWRPRRGGQHALEHLH